MCVRPGLVLDAAVQRTNKSFPFDVIFSIPSTTERKERDDWEGGGGVGYLPIFVEFVIVCGARTPYHLYVCV